VSINRTELGQARSSGGGATVGSWHEAG
jgi:hypothetical protein